MDVAPPPNPYEAPRASIEALASEGDPGRELASRWRRLGAALLDGLLVAVATAPGVLGAGGVVQCGINIGRPPINPADTSPPGMASTILFLALVAVQSYFIATRGQSLGKRIAGTRITTLAGGPPSFLNGVVLRTWIPLLLPFLPWGGSLLAVVDVLFVFGPNKRCLHDRWAGTRVVVD